jgi:glycosyltransferase involved in cell wall biosynthesis
VRDAGFPATALDTALGGAAGPLRAFRKLRAAVAGAGPDLVHAYGLRPSLLLRFLTPRPPLVQAVHSIDAHRPWWQAVLDRETAGRVDRHLVNSEAGAAFLAAKRGVARDRIRVVANGIDVEAVARAATERDRARAALGLGAGAPVILTVANLRPPKGLEVLARTAARLAGADCPPWVWLIAGEGPLATSLAAELAERELAARVRLLGFRRDVPALLAACDVFCLTSHREGVPVSILEAMAAGKPVVATAVGGVGELVVESGTPDVAAAGATGLLAPAGDDRRLAAALAALLADPARRAAMGAAGQARARAAFTLERAAAEIAAVYRELIPARRG